MSRGIALAAALVGLAAVFACQENIPDEGPQQPANTPLPKIDPPHPEPAQTPTAPSSMPVGDGGK